MKRFHGFELGDPVPPGYLSQGAMKLFGREMILPPNFLRDQASVYFENRWLNDVNDMFYINTFEVENRPDAAISGMAAVEGVASTDACTLADNDSALVSLLAIGNDFQGGVNWRDHPEHLTRMDNSEVFVGSSWCKQFFPVHSMVMSPFESNVILDTWICFLRKIYVLKFTQRKNASSFAVS